MSYKRNFVVTIDFSSEQKQALINDFKNYDNVNFQFIKPSELEENDNLKNAEVLMGFIPPKALKKADNLKWLQLASSGADMYVSEEVLNKNVLLSSSTGAYGQQVAEHAFALMHTLIKKIHLYRDNQNNALWHDEGGVSSISEKTVLLLGLGDIGQYFAKMVRPMCKKLIGVRRSSKKCDLVDEVHTFESLNELLPQADVIMMSLPSTKETINLINKERLLLFKKDAIIINVGRGTAIDSDALCDAVDNGALYAAGLDVTHVEPLFKESRLWSTKNILITPHSSGGFRIKQTKENVFNIFKDNVEKYLNNEKLNNTIDREIGYAAK